MPTSDRRQLILHPGAELGGYTIDEVLGMGGMAVVYRATQRSLRRPVALKVLDPRLSDDESFCERFRREGAHVASLDHAHIVPVHDSGEVDGRLYLAMRLVEGDTLADRMRRPGLSAAETVHILTRIAGALDIAHAAGVLHRDVKPQNILLAGDHPYLADFGVAKGAGSPTMTGSGGFLGSVHYASPEQIRGESMGPATDVYSLAAVAYECFTGKAPFTRPSEVGVMHAHLEEPPPPLPGKLGAGSRELSNVLAHGLAKTPAARHPSAGAFAADLEHAVGRLSSAERSRRPAFRAAGDAPRGGTTPSSAETALVGQFATDTPAPAGRSFAGGTETVDLPRAQASGGGQRPGATVHDRQSRLVPRPEPRTEPSRVAWLRRPFVVAGIVALLAAVGVVVALARRDAPATTISAGQASFAVPDRWTASGALVAARFGGLAVDTAAGAAAAGTAGAWLAAAPLVRGSSLRPPAAAAAARAVTAGDGVAYRWDLPPASGFDQRIIVIPAAAGSIALSCGWPSGQANGPGPCDGALATLAGLRGQSPAGAARADVSGIAAAVRSLRSARSALLPRAAAKRPAVAKDLERAHVRAAAALAAVAAKARWDTDLAAAATHARAAGHQYERLASAADRHDRTADAAARGRLARADTRLRRSLAAISARAGGATGLPSLGAARLTTLLLPPVKRRKAAAKSAEPQATPSVAAAVAAPVTSAAPALRKPAAKQPSKPKKAAPIVTAPPTATE